MALALLLGSDYRPTLTGGDRVAMEIDQAVLKVAWERHQEHEQASRESLAAEIANNLGPMISQALSQALQSIARAMR